MSEALFQLDDRGREAFAVELDVFQGPFSVLLSLIAKKRLDVTTVALSSVTDEFIAFLGKQSRLDLSQLSEFLVVAATLLDLKLAMLLPREEVDEEVFELLERRDLLFAKLLQYKAFKEVAEDFAAVLSEQSKCVGRDVPLEEHFASILPPIRLGLTPEEFALLATQAFVRETSSPEVATSHLHNPQVSVASQIPLLRRALRHAPATFHELCVGSPNLATIVARFMGILELIRAGEVEIRQNEALSALHITWVGEGTEENAENNKDASEKESEES